MKTKWIPFIFSAALILLILQAYVNQIIYQYAVPPGYDGIPHSATIDAIMGGDFVQILKYHTIWHLFSIPFVWISRSPSITVLAWLGPLLQISMGLSLAYFAKRFFGPVAGLAAFVLMSFFSLQPLQTLIDGGYPNVLAAGTILPFFFIFANYVFSQRFRGWFIPASLVAIIVLAYSHHLTTLYTLPILAVFGIVMIGRNLREKKVPLWAILSSTFGLGLLGLIAAWFFLHLKLSTSVTGLATQFISADTHFPFFHIINTGYTPDALLPLDLYKRDLGYTVIYVGILGYLWAWMRVIFTPRDPAWRIFVLLIIWSSVLFIGSRVGALQFPVRLARDMTIPLTLLGGAFLGELYALSIKTTLRKILFVMLLALFVYLGLPTLNMRYHLVVDPNIQIHHLDVDTQAADYITNNLPQSAWISTFQESLYVDLFTPNHTVSWIFATDRQEAFVGLKDPQIAFEGIDYLYLEHRLNKLPTPPNNSTLVNHYRNAPYITEIASFKQPEKEVYILKINREKLNIPQAQLPTSE